MHSAPSTRRSRLAWMLPVIVLVGALVAAGCGSDDSDSKGGSGSAKLTKITFMSDFGVPWVPQIPWVVANEKGWYKDAGLDVDYQLPQGTAAPARLLGAGKVDMAAVYTADVLNANEAGLSTKVLMSLGSERLPGGVCFLKGSGISKPKDLEGKTVAVYDYPQGKYNFKHFFKANGVDASKVKQVSAGDNSTTLLAAGKVDAIDGATALECPAATQRTKKDYGVFPFDDRYGFPKTYFLELGVNGKWLEKNKDAARKFVQVTQKAISWSEQHQDEALKIFEASDTKNIDPAVAKLGMAGLKKSWCGESYSCWTPKKPIGTIDPKIWNSLATFYADGGLLKKPGDAGQLLTDNSYLSDKYLPKP